MPWTGGVYTRGYPSWTSDANSGLGTSATKFDTEDNDFAAGLNNCLTADGLNKPTSTLNWSVQMNWTRGSDGNIWSLARTGGSNNPKLQGSVVDASGVTLTATGGILALVASGANITLNGSAIQGQGPVAAALVDMTPDKGTFTITLTGMTAGTTATASWSRNGNHVVLNIPVVTGTSNVNTFTCTGLPAAIQPTNQQAVSCTQVSLGAGSVGVALGQISGSTITWITTGSATGFSNSGTKGFAFGATLSYELN